MSYSINNSKSEVINILKKSCNEDPIKNDLIDETFSNNLEIYGTNMLIDNNAQSVKNCEIRQDNSINMANPINKSDDYELESTINKITQELDENQQKLIKMSFFEQKSHKKIAEELEIPLGTVKSRIRATLSKMQKHIL